MRTKRLGFTLMEVVLAIGIFAVGALALVGIFASMLGRSHNTSNSSNGTNILAAARVYLEQQPRDKLDALLRSIDSTPLILYLMEMEENETTGAPSITFASEEEWPLCFQTVMTTALGGNLRIKSVHKLCFHPMISPPETAANVPLQVSIFELTSPEPGESLFRYDTRNQGLLPATYFIHLRR